MYSSVSLYFQQNDVKKSPVLVFNSEFMHSSRPSIFGYFWPQNAIETTFLIIQRAQDGFCVRPRTKVKEPFKDEA